jgi:hypothetical protein
MTAPKAIGEIRSNPKNSANRFRLEFFRQPFVGLPFLVARYANKSMSFLKTDMPCANTALYPLKSSHTRLPRQSPRKLRACSPALDSQKLRILDPLGHAVRLKLDTRFSRNGTSGSVLLGTGALNFETRCVPGVISVSVQNSPIAVTEFPRTSHG